MFQIFIDDEEVTCESNFTIKEEFMNPSSIELYKVFPKKWKGTNKLFEEYYFPEDYSKCKILKDGDLYFSGIVKNTADMELNPFKPHYCSVQILDPSTLLSEGTTLNFVIADKKVSEAILQVIDAISDYGFVAGKIEIPESEDNVIGAYSTLDKAPFDVFQYLSQISGTRWGTHMVDEDTTAIDFYSPELLETKEIIKVEKEYCNLNKIDEITYDYSTTDYRNKQIITSEEVFAGIETINKIISNGYDNVYILEQKIGNIKTITVDGNKKTFATKSEKDSGIVADFYYEASSNQLESAKVYVANSVIIVTYTSIVQGREIVTNISEINRITKKLNRNGTISRYENRSDVISSNELQSVGKSYIKYKGKAEIILNIVSEKDFLNLGSKYLFEAPLKELNNFYLVKSKNTIVLQSGSFLKIKYQYELSNNFDTENEINFFDNQRAKANGNISQGQYISRNIDLESEANIVFNNLNIEQVTVTGDNTLNSVLNSPFIV